MTLQPGFRFGPYEIVSRLGAGGMGEVFHARDTKLNRDVALKVLPQDSPAGMERLRRFEQEARAASQLNHPNIVTIYDIGQIDGVTYIVMELVEGRSLRDLTAERALPLKQVARIGAKVAEGLAAAHERGITHRDLKPENVMVTPEGFVKILDFGLAKLTIATGDSDATVPHTTPGAIFGTVFYMSPEQAAGEASDFRCDQFALGVMLYELVAHKRPFDRRTAVETMTAIIRDEPPPLIESGTLSPQLLHIIGRCLAKEPRERYASTRDLARDLREVRDELSSGVPSGGRSLATRRRPSRAMRRSLVAVAVALLVLAAGAAWRIWHTQSVPPAGGRHALYFMPLRSDAGGRDGEVFSVGLTDAIAAQLAKSPAIRVIRPLDDSAKPANPVDAARRHGADLILQGVAQRVGDNIRISYTILDVKTSSQVGGDSVSGPGGDVFALQDRVAAGVLRATGAPPLAQGGGVAGLDRPADQQSYVTALGLMHRLKDEAALDEAIGRLEALLLNARDSAAVNGALGKALLTKYFYKKENPLVEQASLYAERAAKIDPTLAEVHVTLGELKKTRGDYPGAAAEFQGALALHADLPDAALGLADTYEKMGRAADAEREYQHLLVLAPDWHRAYSKYGAFCLQNRRPEKAVELFRRQAQLLPDSGKGYGNLGAALLVLGRHEEALQALRKSLAIGPDSIVYANLGTCEYNLGLFTDAATSFEKATSMTGGDATRWMNLGDARRWAPGQRPKATAAYERAVERAREALKVNPADGLAHAIIASSLAKIGRSDEAKTELDEALKLEITNPDVLYQAAVVTLLRNDKEGAAAWLRRATAAGYSPDLASRDPELADLR
ncbi:MAG: protein kinase [Acidobacteriota bacterium]